MPLAPQLRSGLRIRLQQYEGKSNHLYLDTKGKVTVGVGHLIPSRNAISSISLYSTKNNLPFHMATLQQKQVEYDTVAKQPWGQRYGATAFKRHTTLVMKDTDIELLLNKHIDSFYRELTVIYTTTNGYRENFDSFHKNIQLALFDMIFNLGAHKIVHKFPSFNAALKARDWHRAAVESNRPDVSAARNQYVRALLQSTPITP